MDTELTLERLQGIFPMFKVEQTENGFRIAADNPDGVVRIVIEPDRSTVLTGDWHGHCDEAREAVWVAYYLFTGRIRTITEWRGDRLAACFSQSFENEWADCGTAAYYLSPFDREEWERWPGDKWTRKIIHRRLLDGASAFTAGTPSPMPELGQVSTVQEAFDAPHIYSRDDLTVDWPNQHLGAPGEGLKWATDTFFCSLFVQIPIGWRSLAYKEDQKFTEFAPPDGPLLLRAEGFWREARQPEQSQVVDQVAYPVETWIERPAVPSKGWASVVMHCRFVHEGSDTLGRLTFYWLPKKSPDPEPLISRLTAAIPLARLWLGEAEPGPP